MFLNVLPDPFVTVFAGVAAIVETLRDCTGDNNFCNVSKKIIHNIHHIGHRRTSTLVT